MLRFSVSSPTFAAGAIGLRPTYGLAAQQRKIALLHKVGHVYATQLSRYLGPRNIQIRPANSLCVYRELMRISLNPLMSIQKLVSEIPPPP